MAANQTGVRPSRSALSADFEKQYAGGMTIRASFVLAVDPPVTSILFGPSGAGKTTILRCIAGLEPITSGTIHFGDEVWSDAGTRRSVPPQRRSLGYLFQDHALFPHLTVRDNVAFGLGGLDRTERNRHVEEACEKLGVEALLERRPDQLSGGQGQRVALARVLVRRPGLLLLDEPFAALDAATRDEVRGYLSGFLRRLEIPALVVTHDWVDALALGDEMIVLDRGTHPPDWNAAPGADSPGGQGSGCAGRGRDRGRRPSRGSKLGNGSIASGLVGTGGPRPWH